MKITKSSVIKLNISELQGIDPINIFLEDYKLGQGKLTVECYGDAWSHYWGAMGERNLIDFLKDANSDYITGKLALNKINQHIVDYDKISNETHEDICCESDLIMYEEEMCETYGEDWRMDLPTKVNHHWEYLYRIVCTIKEAIELEGMEER